MRCHSRKVCGVTLNCCLLWTQERFLGILEFLAPLHIRASFAFLRIKPAFRAALSHFQRYNLTGLSVEYIA